MLMDFVQLTYQYYHELVRAGTYDCEYQYMYCTEKISTVARRKNPTLTVDPHERHPMTAYYRFYRFSQHSSEACADKY